jgi:hypothetical protein
MPRTKEPWVLLRSRGDNGVAREMYRDVYARTPPGSYLVDGSTGYTMRPEYPSVADDARAIAPDAKIVYIVRNPVHRAISHFKHLVAWGVAPAADFGSAVRVDSRLTDFGRYWWQLEPWMEAFGDAVHVVVFEDYTADRGKVVGEILTLLGLESSSVGIDEARVLNQSSQARAVTGMWQRFIVSGLYQDSVRPRIPLGTRAWLRDTVLRKASQPAVVPSRATVDRIIDACREDARLLGAFLGRGEEIWDWDATRRSV